VFGSVGVVAFQIAFRAEIHANDFFYFFKIIFDISTSKRSKKYKPHSILAKKKNFEIWSNTGSTAEPNRLLVLFLQWEKGKSNWL
jgi:hypothetical protein